MCVRGWEWRTEVHSACLSSGLALGCGHRVPAEVQAWLEGSGWAEGPTAQSPPLLLLCPGRGATEPLCWLLPPLQFPRPFLPSCVIAVLPPRPLTPHRRALSVSSGRSMLSAVCACLALHCPWPLAPPWRGYLACTEQNESLGGGYRHGISEVKEGYTQTGSGKPGI